MVFVSIFLRIKARFSLARIMSLYRLSMGFCECAGGWADIGRDNMQMR